MARCHCVAGLGFALMLLTLLGPGVSSASGQRKRLPFPPKMLNEDRGRYPAVPFRSADVQTLFQQQLERARELEVARSFLDQIGKHQNALPPGFDPNDPKWLELIRPLVKDLGDKRLDEMGPEELNRLKEKLESFVPAQGEGHVAPPDGPGSVDAPAALADALEPGAATGPLWSEERLSEMVRDWMENMDQTRMGEWLRDSPTWQNTLSELQRSLNKAGLEPPPDWSFDADFLEAGMQRLRALPPPRLPSLSLPALRMDRVPMPSLGGPSAGGVSTPSGDTLLWLAIAVVVVGIAWFALAHLPRRRATEAPQELGPWPVEPSGVATRTELRIAFEHLALLALGVEARAWNHRRVAAGLGQDARDGARAEAARRLAALYEQARYTAGPEDLGQEEAAQARAHLALLAEASR